MNEAKVVEGKSASSSAGGGVLAFGQIASLNRRAGYCKRLLTLKMKCALTPNTSISMLEDLLQVMRKQLERLASLNAANMKPYQQLMESKALTDEAISTILTQDEASELEYRTGMAELRHRLRASFPTGSKAAAAPLSSTNSGAVLHTSATTPPPLFNFRAPQLELPLFSDNIQNKFAFNLLLIMTFKLPLYDLLRGRALSLLQQCHCT